MLAEYVCKSSVAPELFNIAKELEAGAFKKQFVAPHALTPAAKSYLAVFVDFWGMDRTKILKAFVGRQTEPSSEHNSPAIEPSNPVKHPEAPAPTTGLQAASPEPDAPAPMEPLPTAKEETPTPTNEQKHLPGME